jgi:nucleotide-binding universal stress UspA family protein
MAITEERRVTDGQARRHAYETLLVHVEPGLRSAHRVEIAALLAHDLGARLIGFGAETFEPFMACQPMAGALAADMVGILQVQVNQDLKEAEEAFRGHVLSADSEWRYTQDIPNHAMARAARAADLIIAGPRSTVGHSQIVDPAELVLEAGRPVLIVPLGSGRLKCDRVVVGWKDTREARRAVADALPFLQRASEVIVQAVCSKAERDNALHATNDVAAALMRHGVAAQTLVTHDMGFDASEVLRKTAADHDADLIVAGAFGYRRAHEWLFGGVTRSLIHNPPCFVLLSH